MLSTNVRPLGLEGQECFFWSSYIDAHMQASLLCSVQDKCGQILLLNITLIFWF